jgi:preprotein translocase subunit SecY
MDHCEGVSIMDRPFRLAKQLWSLFGPIAIVLILANNIPLPGLDPEFTARQASGDTGSAAERLSILVLGLTPVLSGLAIGEICRIMFQWCPSPDNAPRSTAPWTMISTRLVVLTVAALQAYGIAEGLEAAGALKAGGSASKPVIILTLVASTAVLLWLSERVRVPGLRHGVWLLWSATFFLSLPGSLAGPVEATRVGAMPAVNWLLSAAYVVFSAAAVVGVNLFWIKRVYANDSRGPRRHSDVLSIFAWPIFLSSYAGGYVLMLLMLLTQGNWQLSGIALKATASLTIAVLIPFFVFGYAQLHLKALEDPARSRSAIYSAAAIIAALEIVLFLLGSFLVEIVDLPLSVNGVLLIVVVTAFLAAAQTGKRSQSSAKVMSG